MSRFWLKYLEVGRTTLRSRWAYVWDQLLGGLFLVIIMFVYIQLWKTTYGATGTSSFAGYTFPEMVWYLVFAEAIVLSLPRIDAVITQEVIDGDLAMRLNKPYNYLLFHYCTYAGDGLLRLGTTLLAGVAVTYPLVGGFPLRWEALPAMLGLYLTTQALHFFFAATIGLGAFWMEDTSGLYLLLDRIKWVLGGFMLPLELYPGVIRKVAEVLPFRYMINGPARLFVKFEWAAAWELLLSQAVWLAVFGVICAAVYRLGVRRVDVNGG